MPRIHSYHKPCAEAVCLDNCTACIHTLHTRAAWLWALTWVEGESSVGERARKDVVRMQAGIHRRAGQVVSDNEILKDIAQ